MRTQVKPEEIAKMKQELTNLEKAFDLLDVHVIVTDQHANIIYANAAAQRATGYTLDEMLGKNPGDLWGGNESDIFYQQMWKTIKEDKVPFVGRVRNKNKQGEYYFQEIHITPLLDEKDEAKYFVALEPDVTAKVINEQQLVANSQKLTDLFDLLLKSEQRIIDLNRHLTDIHHEKAVY